MYSRESGRQTGARVKYVRPHRSAASNRPRIKMGGYPTEIP
ncbi:hypothetical protein FTUN_6110 [Frigoriglobus tundricola]|uniref:Uncharacterized protein n=1 Tax=Frigoriglobus tundricola TaxID=2774151 RepID=A0A6M5YYH7_9BACT|nr:hypothetical protein FTUN_6110 [Frigoriglobus tundricola]